MDIEPHDIIPTDTAADQPAPVFEDFDLHTGHDTLHGGSEGLEAVHDVPVKVQAVLGRARMPIGELLQLGSGTVVELDRRVGEPVDIFVNDRLIARGEVVLIDNALGVTLTEIVRAEH
ncbi:flagellar motor switch protein FliN [Sphingomonas sp. R-74633]|uniref:flagellar motor switch protein FliN n=1 Tax=Sphingomonas sp. R-74633 TaxID=2751188 RepID=UPI0015D40E0E|nr:flagellar motor switch protein FliN [Sphingomonas sp. R-74633]NYT42114.1 flagellar motor switch protein FliN [Sphingomonas sp. R-74633]